MSDQSKENPYRDEIIVSTHPEQKSGWLRCRYCSEWGTKSKFSLLLVQGER